MMRRNDMPHGRGRTQQRKTLDAFSIIFALALLTPLGFSLESVWKKDYATFALFNFLNAAMLLFGSLYHIWLFPEARTYKLWRACLALAIFMMCVDLAGLFYMAKFA